MTPAGIFITELPKNSKQSEVPAILRNESLMWITNLNEGKNTIFHTDGSADPTTERAGAGVIQRTLTENPNHWQMAQETAIQVVLGASSYQTELVAIDAAPLAVEQESAQTRLNTGPS